MREQLAPLAAKIRETRALIRPVSQVLFRLKPVPKKDRFSETVREILRWMDKRAGRRLPEDAWEGKSFELADIGSQRTAAVAIAEPRYWAARLDDADKAVPLRVWVTEIGVGADPAGDVLFGTRLICTTRGEDVPFARSFPGFVRAVVRPGFAEIDGVALQTESARVVSTKDDVDDLIALLEAPSRRLPVIVLALPERSEDPNDAILAADDLVRRTLGVAHVYVLTASTSFYLSDEFGKELSVFRQAVRLYKPGFNRWKDQPIRHPLWLPARIASWKQEGTAEEGPRAFAHMLVQDVLAASVHRGDREDVLPAFNTVRQLAIREDRDRMKRSGTSADELLPLYEQDNEKLRKDLDEQRQEFEGLFATVERERDDMQQQAQEARAQSFGLRERIRALEARLSKVGGASKEPSIPENLDGFETWCLENLPGSVEIHNRALQGIKKSVFGEPALIYRALLLLRDRYVPMRVEGGKDLVDAYKRGCETLKLEESFVGEALKTHRDRYTVNYRGTPRLLEHHLKRGNAHDERHCFRLYFFWDEETQCVVVGWLPSHLDSGLT